MPNRDGAARQRGRIRKSLPTTQLIHRLRNVKLLNGPGGISSIFEQVRGKR